MHKYSYYLVVFVFCLVQIVSYAQTNPKADSLLKILEQANQPLQKVEIYNELADFYSSSDSIMTVKYANQAIELAGENSLEEEIIKAQYSIAWITLVKGNIDKAKKLFLSSLEVSQKLDLPLGKALSFNGLGQLSLDVGDFPEAIRYFQDALQLYQELDNRSKEAGCLINLGVTFKNQGKFEEALNYYQQAIEIFDEIGEERKVAVGFINIGSIYGNQGNYPNSIQYFIKSLAILEKLDEKRTLATIYGNIGTLFELSGNFEGSEEYYLKSLEILKEIGDKGGLALNLNNLGNLYTSLEEYEKALKFLEEGLVIIEEINDKSELAYNHLNQGDVYVKLGKYEKALNYLDIAYTTSVEIGDPATTSEVLLYIGKAYFYLQKLSLSKEYLEKSIEMAEKIGFISPTNEGYEYLAKTNSALGDFKNAYENYVQFKTIADSLINEENTREITRLEVQYEFDKKEKELKLTQAQKEFELQQRNQKNLYKLYGTITSLGILGLIAAVVFYLFYQRNKYAKVVEGKNEQLSKLMSAKEKLFGVIAHDLKTPLSAFSNISSTLAENIEAFSKEDIKAFLEKLVKSTEDLKGLLNNLLQWSLTETGMLQVNAEVVKIPELASEATRPLRDFAAAKNIQIQMDFEDEKAFADKKMIETVIRNLVSNAIKFTEEGGQISLTAKKNPDELIIEVEDTGLGMTPDESNKLFNIEADISKIGDHEGKGTGIGLILCKELVEKNNGRIWVKSEKGKGTKFQFSLPLAA